MATRDGADWEIGRGRLLPGDVLRCGRGTNYVLIVRSEREETTSR